eukprot:PhM_4_TR1919/c0_g1_i1/m.31635
MSVRNLRDEIARMRAEVDALERLETAREDKLMEGRAVGMEQTMHRINRCLVAQSSVAGQIEDVLKSATAESFSRPTNAGQRSRWQQPPQDDERPPSPPPRTRASGGETAYVSNGVAPAPPPRTCRPPPRCGGATPRRPASDTTTTTATMTSIPRPVTPRRPQPPTVQINVRGFKGDIVSLNRKFYDDSTIGHVLSEAVHGGYDLGGTEEDLQTLCVAVPYPRQTFTYAEAVNVTLDSARLAPRGMLILTSRR